MIIFILGVAVFILFMKWMVTYHCQCGHNYLSHDMESGLGNCMECNCQKYKDR